MALLRIDNVLIVVEDIETVKAFFLEIGMEVDGETTVDGSWVGQVVGLDDVRADICVLRTADGHNKIELSQFHTPDAVRSEPADAPSNALGLRRVMFAVDDVEDVVMRLQRDHGGELVGKIVQFEDAYKLCYLRGPEGIVVGLAEPLS